MNTSQYSVLIAEKVKQMGYSPVILPADKEIYILFGYPCGENEIVYAFKCEKNPCYIYLGCVYRRKTQYKFYQKKYWEIKEFFLSPVSKINDRLSWSVPHLSVHEDPAVIIGKFYEEHFVPEKTEIFKNSMDIAEDIRSFSNENKLSNQECVTATGHLIVSYNAEEGGIIHSAVITKKTVYVGVIAERNAAYVQWAAGQIPVKTFTIEAYRKLLYDAIEELKSCTDRYGLSAFQTTYTFDAKRIPFVINKYIEQHRLFEEENNGEDN